MALEQVFECPSTLAKLRSAPLGKLLDVFVSGCWITGSVVGQPGFIWGISAI